MLLNEIKIEYPFNSEKRIENFFHNVASWGNLDGEYTIHDDLTVDINGSISLSNMALRELPIKFGKVTGSFSCYENKLRSLKGCPHYVGESFSCHTNPFLTSLEYAPEYVGTFVCCSSTSIRSLHGLQNHIKEVGPIQYGRKGLSSYEYQFFLDMPITNLLALFLVKGIEKIKIGKAQKLTDIINKHLETGDIHSCQEELLEKGYTKEARI